MKSLSVAFWILWSAFGVTPPSQMPAPTVLGPKGFFDGDVIEITDVQATSTKLEQGDSLTVRGRYQLESHEDAELSLYLTQTQSSGPTPVDPAQKMRVEKGRGEFELKTTIRHRGALHLSFYDTESGQGMGGVYFGTPDQMKAIEHWNVGPREDEAARHAAR